MNILNQTTKIDLLNFIIFFVWFYFLSEDNRKKNKFNIKDISKTLYNSYFILYIVTNMHFDAGEKLRKKKMF